MSAAAWADVVPSLWEARFAREVEETRDRHEVPVSEWRTAGRRSKARPRGEDLDWWRVEGLRMVERYVSWREATQYPIWSTPDGAGPGIELELFVPFGQIPVHMFIDRIFATDEGPVIVDLKTGSREPDSALQLAFYACGLEIAYGVRPHLGAYWMGRTGELTRPYILDHLSTALLTNWLARFDRAVRGDIFLPHPSRLCASCGVANACAAVGGPDAWRYDLNHPDFTGEVLND